MALVITPIVITVSHSLRIYDGTASRKVHTGQIPRLGGVAIFLSSTLLVMTALFLDNAIGEKFREIQTQVIALLCAAGFIFLVGMIDDIRGVRVRYKLLAQIVAASAVCLAGIRIESLNFANLFVIQFGIFSFPLTILWIIGITNAVNLIDGLDGLAAGISAITCTVIAVFSLISGHHILAVIMLALMGSLSGFLFFNFNPAKVFMGDCGSLFLGFVLGSASVMCAVKSGTMVAIALPALVLGLPLFDTAFSILRRYLGRWSITSADRGHLHHRLLDIGLRHHHVVIVMYSITAIAAGLGMFMVVTQGYGTLIILFCVMLLFLLVFRAVGAVRLRETIAMLKYNQAISKEANEDASRFQNINSAFYENVSFRQWWRMVSDEADKEDFSELCLTVTGKNGRRHKFVWESNKDGKEQSDVVTVKIPLSKHRFGREMEIEAKISANGLMESTGRRLMLFGRLIDEYSQTTQNRPIVELENADQAGKAQNQMSITEVH